MLWGRSQRAKRCQADGNRGRPLVFQKPMIEKNKSILVIVKRAHLFFLHQIVEAGLIAIFLLGGFFLFLGSFFYTAMFLFPLTIIYVVTGKFSEASQTFTFLLLGILATYIGFALTKLAAKLSNSYEIKAAD